MTRFLRALPSLAAASLFAAGAALAASPLPVTDELLAPLESAYERAVKPGEQVEPHRELFGTVLRRVQRSYAHEVDVPGLVAAALKTLEPLEPQSGEPAEVFRKAINAALASLDPHSRYLDARAQSNQRSAITGTFGGLGLQVDMVDGLVRVVAPMDGTPAARAGLQSGDLIVRFDDQPVLGMALPDAISRMRGQPGTPIALMIRRAGREGEFTVSLVRETIRTQTLRWSMHGDVLVLRLASFTSSATASIEKAIAEATATRMPRAVVLDMRGNPGGLLREGVSLADAFLDTGEIVSLRGRTPGNRRIWKANAAQQLAGVPMVVLVDGRSASAAELVAAALQENGRAIVMGQRSFGKGSVQSIVSLGEGQGALRLTTALYHGPSGRTVQRTGVGPDIELFTEAATASGSRREADRAHALPGADEPLPPKARVEQTRCAPAQKTVDPGLACALAFLEAGGMETFLVALQPAEASEAH
ncbi:MAG TPA: S41 family peptidase [Burkholderiales bacterium]|nr:S41 family peptidase [Burkholderiales bacterium]